jgi:O-antigen ligase
MLTNLPTKAVSAAGPSADSMRRLSAKSLGSAAVLLLLITTPLLYSADGDANRSFKVIAVGAIFLVLCIGSFQRLGLWIRTGLIAIAFACGLIAIQPVFVADLSYQFNVNFAIVLFCSALPIIAAGGAGGAPRFNSQLAGVLINTLIYVSTGSIIVSSITGLGEVYLGAGVGQGRAFGWLGDSFSPVVVFFIFYTALARNYFGLAVSVVCLVLVMQAKMAVGMVVFGAGLYLLIFGSSFVRILVLLALVGCLAAIPEMEQWALGNLHNFDYTLNTRLLSIEAGLDFAASSPWFGVGVNQTYAILSQASGDFAREYWGASEAYYDFFQIHNSFVRTVAEQGAVGLCLLVLFCAILVRNGYGALAAASRGGSRVEKALLAASGLWVMSFILFYQTTGWYEPGHPQLAWLVTISVLGNSLFSTDAVGLQYTRK